MNFLQEALLSQGIYLDDGGLIFVFLTLHSWVWLLTPRIAFIPDPMQMSRMP